jgi:hypothetical protein
MAELKKRIGKKFGNHITERGDLTFHSKKEARRYDELCLLQKAGEITALQLQPKFPFHVAGKLICTYHADFQYLEKDGRVVVEDVKSAATRKDPVYRIKAKLFEAVVGFPVREV